MIPDLERTYCIISYMHPYHPIALCLEIAGHRHRCMDVKQTYLHKQVMTVAFRVFWFATSDDPDYGLDAALRTQAATQKLS